MMSIRPKPAPRPALVVDRFCAGTLPHDEWTHEAHLMVARTLVCASREPASALRVLRRLIVAHNERHGVPPDRGYHDTITRYYVAAVLATRCAPVEEVLADPRCSREAPGRHWSAELLASDAARAGWVEPDLAPLPFPAVPDQVTAQIGGRR